MMYRYDMSTYTCIYRQLVKIDKRKEDEQERQKDAPAGDATEHKGVQAEGEGGFLISTPWCISILHLFPLGVMLPCLASYTELCSAKVRRTSRIIFLLLAGLCAE